MRCEELFGKLFRSDSYVEDGIDFGEGVNVASEYLPVTSQRILLGNRKPTENVAGVVEINSCKYSFEINSEEFNRTLVRFISETSVNGLASNKNVFFQHSRFEESFLKRSSFSFHFSI